MTDIRWDIQYQDIADLDKEHDMEKPGDKIRIPLVKHGMDMTFAIINIIYLSLQKIILYQSHIGSKNLDSSVL